MQIAKERALRHINQAWLQAELMPRALAVRRLADEHLIDGVGGILEAMRAIEAHFAPESRAIVEPHLLPCLENLVGAHGEERVGDVASVAVDRHLEMRLVENQLCIWTQLIWAAGMVGSPSNT